MSQDPTGLQNPNGSQSDQNNGNTWYTRPWFWSILILLLILSFLAWIFWKQWQANVALEAAMQERLQDELQLNAELEAKIKNLRDMLSEDPCVIKEFLNNEHVLLLPSTTPSIEENNTKNMSTQTTKAEAPPPPPLQPPLEQGATIPKHNKLNPQNDNIPLPKDTKPKSSLPMSNLMEQATVLIINDSKQGVKTGTGFFIAKGIILTNAHVAQNRQDKIYVIGQFNEIVTNAQIIAVSDVDGRDYAVLQVPITSIQPLSFALDVARTQKISAWGFPGVVTDIDPNFRALLKGEAISPPEVVYSEGNVSVVQDQTPPIIFHSAVVSHGNSGGPLVNEKGDVVGINTYISLDDKSYRQSSIAIVSKDIVNFLQANNIPFTIAGKE